MDEDLLIHNKYTPDLNISNEYMEDIKHTGRVDNIVDNVRVQNNDPVQGHSNVEQYIKNKTTKNYDSHKVYEKSYVYNINSKNRQSFFLTTVENTDNEIPDIDKLNAYYNALNVPNSVVDPYVMIDGILYFKKFQYQYPNDYIIELPFMHTNVKMIRILGSFLPYNANNVNAYNNHVAVDVLFGNIQMQENIDDGLVFGTHIVSIPPGNYTIDEVCLNIINDLNTYYYENFINNSDEIYDDIIQPLLFSYEFNHQSKEVKFIINQPSNKEVIETITIEDDKLNENLFYYTVESMLNIAVLNVKKYTNFFNFIHEIASSMNNSYFYYSNTNYSHMFMIFLRNNKYYLCSTQKQFSLNNAMMPNISTTLNLQNLNSSNDVLKFVETTKGYDNFISFSTNSKNILYFSVDSQNFEGNIPDRQYDTYEDFISNVIFCLNNTYTNETGNNANFNFEIQQQARINQTNFNIIMENNYYISSDLNFSFNCENMQRLASKIFGPDLSSVIHSTVHSILLENEDFSYNVSGTKYIHFIFNNVEYTSVLEPKNYNNYENFLAEIVNSMNYVCSQGYFSYEPLENSQNNYKICSQGNFEMQFSKMPVLGSVLFYPPVLVDNESTNNCIELLNGYEIFNNNTYYNAYTKSFSEFYLSVREQEPEEPYEDNPEFTNKLFIINLQKQKYTSTESLLNEIISGVNNAVSSLEVEMQYSFENNILNVSISENKYEFNINSNLMPDLCHYLGIDTTKDVNYYTTYTSKYDYGNMLMFKMSFENNPNINENDQLWYMLGYRLNNSINYVQKYWSNLFNFGKDSYHFTNLEFVDKFIPTLPTELLPEETLYRPYRFPSMDKNEYIYLKLNNYENIYDPVLVNHKLFTMFHFDANNFGKYTTNNFIDKPYVFETTLSKLNKLHLTFIDSNGNKVDFGDNDHYITIEIVEFKDMLTNNNYNTRRGQNENENYTNALFLNYGVNRR